MIKNITVPDCVRIFSCIGPECTDTCCAGWQVDVDNISWEYYRDYVKNHDNKFAKFLDSVSVKFADGDDSDGDRGCFKLKENGWCPFLNENLLCDMYTELGEEHLCRTCDNYPRYMEDYGDDRELGIAFSCPEASRLMLASDAPMTFSRINVEEALGRESFRKLENDRDSASEIESEIASEISNEISTGDETQGSVVVSDGASVTNAALTDAQVVLDVLKRTAITDKQREKIAEELKKEQLENGYIIDSEEFETEYYEALLEARETAYRIVQNRNYSIEDRVRLYLDYALAVQEVIDSEWGEESDGEEYDDTEDADGFDGETKEDAAGYFDEGVVEEDDADEREDSSIKSKIRQASNYYLDAEFLDERIAYLNENCADVLDLYGDDIAAGEFRYSIMPEVGAVIYAELPHCKAEWEPMLKEAEEVLHQGMDSEEYKKLYLEFRRYMKDREYEYEHLLSYLVFRYFLKGYFDDDVYGKAQVAVVEYLLITELGVLEYYKSGNCERELSKEAQAWLFHLYSRELEHSVESYDEFVENIKTEEFVNFEHLFGILSEWNQEENIR